MRNETQTHNLTRKVISLGGASVLALGLPIVSAFTSASAFATSVDEPAVVSNNPAAGAKPSPLFLKKRAELKRLKEENPELFRERLKERQANMRERLQNLKETDPEKFREVMKKRKARKLRRLEHLKQNQPEQYDNAMRRRQADFDRKIERFRQRDPQAVQDWIQDHPRARRFIKNQHPHSTQNAADQRPDRPLYRDRDNNPPGPVGGRGTNWENPRGPKGGPGAGPDRQPRAQKHIKKMKAGSGNGR